MSLETYFAVVCSNCHSMLHRKEARETFHSFKEYFNGIQLEFEQKKG